MLRLAAVEGTTGMSWAPLEGGIRRNPELLLSSAAANVVGTEAAAPYVIKFKN